MRSYQPMFLREECSLWLNNYLWSLFPFSSTISLHCEHFDRKKHGKIQHEKLYLNQVKFTLTHSTNAE